MEQNLLIILLMIAGDIVTVLGPWRVLVMGRILSTTLLHKTPLYIYFPASSRVILEVSGSYITITAPITPFNVLQLEPKMES